MPPPSRNLTGKLLQANREASAEDVGVRLISEGNILAKVVAENKRLTEENKLLEDRLSKKSQALEQTEQEGKLNISDISGVDIYSKDSLLVHIIGLDSKAYSVLAKYDGTNFNLVRYDAASQKEGGIIKFNVATLHHIFKIVAENLLAPAVREQEIAIRSSRFGGEKENLERQLADAESRASAATSEADKLREKNIALGGKVAEYDKIIKQSDKSSEVQQQESKRLKDLLNIVTTARLKENGFTAACERDGRSVKILVNEAGAYYVDGDNLEELADSDPLNILSEIFGKHYAAFVKQEADLSDRIGVVKQKETELLAAMGVKEGELNINKYNNNVDAALGLLEKIQNVTRAKIQAHTNFVSRLNAVLLKTAKDFEIGDDIISSYRSKLGSDSSAAVAYLLEAVKKAGQNAGLAHRAADYFKGLAEKIDVDFASRLAGKSDDDIVKASTVLILEYVGTRKKEEKNTAAAQQAIRNSWADYISRLAGLPVDAGSLDASNAGSLQDLLNSAIKKKRAEWQFGILKEIYEKLPENYGHGLPENAELGVGIDRLARDLEQLAQDAQEAKAAKAEAELAKQRAAGLETDLKIVSREAESAKAEASSAKTTYEALLAATRERADDKEKRIADKEAFIAQKDREIDMFERQLAERDGKLLDAARQLSEKEQQIQALEQELQAKAAQDKRPAKIVKKTVRKQGEETVPETPLEETEQRPPAV